MALSSTKQTSIHGKTGSDLAAIKASFDNGEHTALADFGPEAAIIYQMQQMQDEITYLRTEISANKDKTTFPGLGTSSSTALAGNTTTISNSQASAITANTAKVSLAGGSATTLSFGELITTTHGTGKQATTAYTIVMTATKSGVTKTVTLTLT